ncbi:MAG: tRNA (N6-isopentenyl adenosine(37)-C2)-methylthiotransferase MiaB, partial [Clostridia bacterium]|nr:tRNA (N6-isopentenyl adenosine(37)-C2)-methylthiotransferase MiaB [Clostridia bacterium]
EKMAGVLEEMGYEPTEDESKANVIVFNTCCVRDNAERRIQGTLGILKQEKLHRKDLIIAVVGCMTQQKGAAELLKKKFPFIDIILGTANLSELKSAILARQKGKRTLSVRTDSTIDLSETMPVARTSYPNAWINIMYGCNNFCTYCIVPYVRGRERSRKIGDVVKDVRDCLDQGYKEITLLGQNVDSYGSDLQDGTNFGLLLAEIAKLPGKFRLRFMSSHPKDFDSSVIDVMASSDNICNNVHLPVQSGSSRILKAMNRRYDRDRYLAIIDEIRAKMPSVGITTDIMIGFPGETDEDFEETMSLVENVRFSNAFMFVYSPRKGTPAAEMPQIPADVKKARITRLVATQNRITKEISDTYLGTTLEVLIEDINPKHEGTVCGRTESGRLVTMPGDPELIGKFALVKINKNQSASLFGEIEEIL